MKFLDITKTQIYCKSCFETLKISNFRRIVEVNPVVCDLCLKKIDSEIKIRRIEGVEVLFLSKYSGLMKEWLMNYKENGDVELANCFLSIYKFLIDLFFNDCIFTFAPSSKENEERRGFSHLKLILENSKLKYADLLIKESTIEQKEMKMNERHAQKNIRLKENVTDDYSKKKIVIFDDVMTSGETFKESLSQIKTLHPKAIYGLILMDNNDVSKYMIK